MEKDLNFYNFKTTKMVRTAYTSDLLNIFAAGHFVPHWQVTAFRNDVIRPIVWFVVNSAKNSSFTQERIVTTLHHSTSCPPVLYSHPQRAVRARVWVANK